jgi:hypothetical protein
VVRAYDGETPSIIPGFKTVSMRDVIMQPGSKTMGPPMENAMVCHITEGELRVEHDGKTFTAKKDFVWSCNKDTKEQSFNDGRVVAIMRITDLKSLNSEGRDCPEPRARQSCPTAAHYAGRTNVVTLSE